MRFVPDMENVKGAKLAKRVPNQIYQTATYAPTSSYMRDLDWSNLQILKIA